MHTQQVGQQLQEAAPTEARKKGRFVDLCPNAGKCDFSPDQKIGGEIINLDIEAVKQNMANVDLGAQSWAQNLSYQQANQQKIEQQQFIDQPVISRVVDMPLLGTW